MFGNQGFFHSHLPVIVFELNHIVFRHASTCCDDHAVVTQLRVIPSFKVNCHLIVNVAVGHGMFSITP